MSTKPQNFEVENHVPSSWFNLSCNRSLTMPVMVEVPVYTKEILAGDKWRIKPVIRVRTMPFAQSLMGSFSVQLAWFFEPDSNLYGYMSNNSQMSAEEYRNTPLHTVCYAPPSVSDDDPYNDACIDVYNHWSSDGYSICQKNNSGTLLNYLGIPADYNPFCNVASSVPRYLNAHRILTYLDIIRNYYVNRQIGTVPFISGNCSWTPGDTFDYGFVSLKALDAFFSYLRSLMTGQDLSGDTFVDFVKSSLVSADELAQFSVMLRAILGSSGTAQPYVSTDVKTGQLKGEWSRMPVGSGLFCANYRSDVYTRVMAKSTGFEATIPVSGSKFSYNNVIGASRLQAFINNFDITGGRWSDMMRFRWGVDVNGQTDKPYLLSVETIQLNVSDMRTTSDSPTGTPAATQVGYIDIGDRAQKISFNASCSGTLMCIATIIPNVSYSEDIEQEQFATKFFDRYQPELANVSFVDMPRGVFSVLPKSLECYGYKDDDAGTKDNIKYYSFDIEESQGRTVAWWNYMTDVNRSAGNLASGQSMEAWILNRSFNVSSYTNGEDFSSIRKKFAYTSYGLPTDTNYAFVDIASGSQNFIFQIGLDCQVRRAIPKFNLPKVY